MFIYELVGFAASQTGRCYISKCAQRVNSWDSDADEVLSDRELGDLRAGHSCQSAISRIVDAEHWPHEQAPLTRRPEV